MNLSVYIFMYKWCRAHWHYLNYGNILHKKGMKLNTPFLSTKQPIYFLFIIFDDNILVASSICGTFLYTIYKTEKYLCDSSWYMVAVSSWMARFGCCIVRVCACVRTCDPCIHNLSNIPCMKKTRTMRSGDSTVHGIPNTWNCCLLFMNTLNNPLNHCHLEGFEITWRYLFFSMRAPAPTLASQSRSAFWNVSVGSVPHCIRLIFLWQCRVHLPFRGFIWLVFFDALLFTVCNSQETFVHAFSYFWALCFVKLIDSL
jgi:hypothetical protein